MRRGPLLVTFLSGFAVAALFFIPNYKAQAFNSKLLEWTLVVYAFALILGSMSLWNSHARKVRTRAEGWIYSIVTLSSLAAITVLGIWKGVGEGHAGRGDLRHGELASGPPPCSRSWRSSSASAAFRAFRARSVEATLLLITAIVMMIGRVSIGPDHLAPSPGHHRMAARRPEPRGQASHALGVGLGAVSTALKIILGIEQSYLGRS